MKKKKLINSMTLPVHKLDPVNPFPSKPWLLHVCSTSLLKTLWGKGEIACYEQFLLFPQCFLAIWITICQFSLNLKLSSVNPLSLEKSKICRLGKG